MDDAAATWSGNRLMFVAGVRVCGYASVQQCNRWVERGTARDPSPDTNGHALGWTGLHGVGADVVGARVATSNANRICYAPGVCVVHLGILASIFLLLTALQHTATYVPLCGHPQCRWSLGKRGCRRNFLYSTCTAQIDRLPAASRRSWLIDGTHPSADVIAGGDCISSLHACTLCTHERHACVFCISGHTGGWLP